MKHKSTFKNLLVIIIAAVILTSLLPVGALAEQDIARPDTSGALHVEGTALCDKNGNAVTLKGVSTHGLLFYPELVNAELFSMVSREWGANLIRLPVYSEDYCDGGEKESLDLLYKGIDAAIAADMYVIADWHILNDGNPLTNAEAALEFFTAVSKKYADCPNVIYEICNEPNGDTAWSDIVSYAERVIPVIKSSSPDAVILVGTPSYSGDLDSAAAQPLEGYSNIMCSFHFYASEHGEEYRARLTNAREKGLPVFVSECGITEADGDGGIDYAEAAAWFELLDEYDLSYAVWSFSNAEESSAMLKSYVTRPETLDSSELTECGQFVKALINGTAPSDIPQTLDTSEGFRDLWYGGVALPLAVFSAAAGVLILLTLAVKQGKKKKNRDYNELLKRTGEENREKVKGRLLYGKLALVLSTLTSLVYLSWRVFFSVPTGYGVFAVVCNILLLTVELLGFWESLVHYDGMLKLRDYPLPEISAGEYPHVDIFVATYNEPTELLRKTLTGCRHMEYPDLSRVHIYLCDDNRRSEMRALAEELGVGYFDRPDNNGAKAGNLNCAMARTSSPYVVTFDADMIPKSDFLLKTIPYFVDAEKRNALLPENEQLPLGFIQTPQCFYNPDVFQHNLYAEKRVPNEQDFFYRTVEPARTASNSVIYGGSNTILSRKAIEAIGGFYTGSITEDFATGLLIEAAGFVSLGLGEPLASGLAPSSFAEHIQQRTRWGRGVILTAKKLKFLRSKALSTGQKMSYLSSVTYWLSPLKNWIYILSPLMFAVFGVPVFKCTVEQLAVFWLPMFICQSLCLRLISHGSISTKWSGIQETVVMPFLLVPIIKESLGISLTTFKVTKKQVASGRRERSTKAKIPFYVLSLLSVFGIVRVSLLIAHSVELGLVAVLFWLVRNLYYILMCLFLIDGRDSDGENVSVIAAEPVCVMLKNGRVVEGITTRLTEHSLNIFADETDILSLGESAELELMGHKLTGTVVAVRKSQKAHIPSVYTVEILDFFDAEDEYIYHLYNRVPTLPQSLTRDFGLLPDLWINLVKHTADRIKY